MLNMTIETIEKQTWEQYQLYKRGKAPRANINRMLKKLNKMSPERCMQLRSKAQKILF